MKILHIINSLDLGGAEKNLYTICKNDDQNEHIVISLKNLGYFGKKLERIRVKVFQINLDKNFLNFFKIILILIKIKPNLVQTWMYISDLIGSLVCVITFKYNLIWGVRHTNLNPKIEKKRTLIILKILSKISYYIPKKIIFCALKSLDVHSRAGYDAKKSVYIHNGIDLKKFFPKKESKKKLFKELNLDKNEILIGTVGRFNLYKDFNTLFDAMGILKSKGIKFKLILAGRENVIENIKLKKMIDKNKLIDVVYLLGVRNDIPDIMNALDIYIQSSMDEASPNVVMEAMACGTPCVVTDVGDSARIVGNTGWIVSPQNSTLMDKTIQDCLKKIGNKDWNKICDESHKRIKDNFSLESMINSYRKIWSQINIESKNIFKL